MKILALDIGGTRLKYAIYNELLQEEVRGEIDSSASEGAEKLLSQAFTVCDNVNFDLLGISTAGMVSGDGTIVYANENIPRYTGVKLKEIFEARYGVQTYVLNDIAAGAMAEAYLSAENEGSAVTSEEADNFYYLALGTGVGGIAVKNGMVETGTHGISGQIGYLPSADGCDSIDRTASARGLESTGKNKGEKLFADAENGDIKAKAALKKWSAEVMRVIAAIIGYCDPPRIVIGGGISRQGETLLRYLKEQEEILPIPYRGKVRLCTAKNSCGTLGAAVYALKKLKKQTWIGE